MANEFKKIDKRYRTTTDSVGLIVGAKDTAWTGLKEYEESHEFVFNLPPPVLGHVPQWSDYSFDGVGQILANEEDKKNYQDFINPEKDTEGRLDIDLNSAFSIDSSAIERLSGTGWAGYTFPDDELNRLLKSIRVPRDANLNVSYFRIRLWFSMFLNESPSNDVVKFRIRAKFSKKDGTLEITGNENDPDGWNVVINKTKVVNATQKIRERVSFDLDDDISEITVQDSIDIEIGRVGDDVVDTRVGKALFKNLELVYQKKIDKDDSDPE